MNDFMKSWKNFISDNPTIAVQKPRPRQIISEISKSYADDLLRWMANRNIRDYDLDELFGDAMRIHIPLQTEDQQKLTSVVKALFDMGWRPEFETYEVMQKLRRLGGEVYEEERTVARLNLTRTYDFVIPKGPREGESIQKKEKTTMSRAIARLSKSNKVPEEVAEWWQSKQVFYTKEDNWEKIEKLFSEGGETVGEDLTVVVSRHPMDVLRMSDVDSIRSCHSEGSEYFHCAVAEARGHGPIAYVIEKSQLNYLLNGVFGAPKGAERPEPITTDDADVLDWGDDWDEWDGIDSNVKLSAAASIKRWVLAGGNTDATFNKFAASINDAEEFEKWVDKFKAVQRFAVSDMEQKGIDSITADLMREAIRAKLNGEQWPPIKKDIFELKDFDEQEIFRDSQRNIKGIGAETRVRLRKFEDTDSGVFFAVPESRTYGHSIPGLVSMMRDWAWNKQKELFTDDDGDVTEDSIPEFYSMTRHGGSYGDNMDSEILNYFFKRGNLDVFGHDENVDHEVDEAEDQTFNEWSEAIDDINEWAANHFERVRFTASIEPGDEPQHPYVGASATIRMRIPIGWEGDIYEDNGWYHFHDEASDYTMIPMDIRHGEHWKHRSGFTDVLIDNGIDDEISVEDASWKVVPSDEGPMLEFSIDAYCEDCSDTDDVDYYSDHVKEQWEDKFDVLYEKVRKALVEEGYIQRSDWDRLADNIERQSTELKHFQVTGEDEDEPDGEVWLTAKSDDPTQGTIIKTSVTIPEQLFDLAKGEQGLDFATRPGRGEDIPTMAREIFGGRWFRGGGSGGYIQGSHTQDRFYAHLKKLEQAANGYAKSQLELPFGDKYKRPEFKGVDMAKDSEFRIYLSGRGESLGIAQGQQKGDLNLSFYLKIVIKSQDTAQEIEGALHFAKFVDNHFELIIKAAEESFRYPVETALEVLQDNAERIDNGSMAQSFIEGIEISIARAIGADGTEPEAMQAAIDKLLNQDPELPLTQDRREGPRTAQMAANNIKLLNWMKKNYSRMNPAEKYVSLKYYLQALPTDWRRGPMWEEEDGLPISWTPRVRTELERRGAWFKTHQNYSWQDKGSPEPQLKGTLGEPRPAQENLEKGIDMDKVNRILQETLGELKEAEETAVRVYEVTLKLSIKKGMSTRDDAVTDIRSISGVTICTVVPGSTYHGANFHYLDCVVKFHPQNEMETPETYLKRLINLINSREIPGCRVEKRLSRINQIS